MAVTVEMIHHFFKQYGWQYEFDQASATWVTGFRGDSGTFNIVAHLSENWIYLIISPFVSAPREERCAFRLHHYLLRLNHSVNMAKFSVDDEGDVILTVELPTESLAYSEFADGLNALSYYADTHFHDVLRLSQDPEYQPTELAEELDMWTHRGNPSEFGTN